MADDLARYVGSHLGLLSFEDLIPTPMKTSAPMSRKKRGESISWYFNDADKTNAESIAASLKSRGFASAHAKKVTLFKVKPGSLEVWFSSDE
ncbi:MAG: hypothetical protein ABI409_05100 [Ramlibacter sp.]